MSDIPVRQIKREKPETVVETKMVDATTELLSFVNDKIKLIDSKLLFNGSREPSIWELNQAIAEWPRAHLAIISLYEQAVWKEDIAKASYNEFLSTKLTETRTEYNKTGQAKSTWLSATEIENLTKTIYKIEVAELYTALKLAEREKSTISRIMGAWENYSFQLNQISKNTIADTHGDYRASRQDFNPAD